MTRLIVKDADADLDVHAQRIMHVHIFLIVFVNFDILSIFVNFRCISWKNKQNIGRFDRKLTKFTQYEN